MSSTKEIPESKIQGLPYEILLDILSRLPVTSLLEAKLVCQAWHTIAQDHLLVPLHFSRTTETDPFLILHSDVPNPNDLHLVDLTDADNREASRTVRRINVPELPAFNVVGSCNGLLCLLGAPVTLYIYNPFILKLWQMPKFKGHSANHIFGFGYNQTTMEHKVVSLVSTVSFDRRNIRGNPTSPGSSAHVLTIGNVSWRRLGIKPYHFIRPLSQVSVHGRLHWAAHPNRVDRRVRNGRLIISFDLDDEQFREVAKPVCGSLDTISYQLVALNGSLSAVVHLEDGKLEIWVMKEYNQQESWIKEFIVGNYLPRGLEIDEADQPSRGSMLYFGRATPQVLYMTSNGEIVLDYRRRSLVFYYPRNGTFTDLMLQHMPSRFHATVHVGSLNQI